MKVYLLKVLENDSYGDGDWIHGVYSSREKAHEAFVKFIETSEAYIDYYLEHIVEYILDD